jgi:hypothetical protein
MIDVPWECGDKGFGFALAIIVDDESRDLLYLFFHDGLAEWHHDSDDVLYSLMLEYENEQRTKEARAVLKKWYALFDKKVQELTIVGE